MLGKISDAVLTVLDKSPQVCAGVAGWRGDAQCVHVSMIEGKN